MQGLVLLKALLRALATPAAAEAIAKQVEQPLFKVRSSLRELAAAGLIREDGQEFLITESGKARL
jgi:DNA-binding IclR family transcriptional regulator